MLLLIACLIASALSTPMLKTEKMGPKHEPEPFARVQLQKVPNSPSRVLRGTLARKSLEAKHSREVPSSVVITNFAGE